MISLVNEGYYLCAKIVEGEADLSAYREIQVIGRKAN